MPEPLEELYFRWLYGQVANVRLKNPARTYWELCKQLHATPFVWWVPNDDNRALDGCELRYEFVEYEGINDADANWLGLDCSIFEMLIALSRRLSFDAEGEPRGWFWFLLGNLSMAKINDLKYNDGYALGITETLDRLNQRTYLPDGQGGLFPLRNPDEDQRNVEIWYQWCSYTLENEPGEEG